MTDKLYDAGYSAYIECGEMTQEFIKSQPYLWRAGYQRAVLDNLNAKNTSSISLTLYEVKDKTKPPYVPTYSDILGATRRPRFEILHRRELNPLLNMLVNSVEKKIDRLHSYREVLNAVDDAFDIILQYGYDNGILDKKDLEKYMYNPK